VHRIRVWGARQLRRRDGLERRASGHSECASLSQAQPLFGAWGRGDAGMQEPIDQSVQIETAVDPVLGLGEVAGAVLVDVDMGVGTAYRGLEVADDGVDPLEDAQFARFAGANRDGGILGHHHRGGRQALQGIGDQMGGGMQGLARPLLDRGALEIGQRVEAHIQGVAFVTALYRGDERCLVLGAAAGFALMDTAEVGVVGDHHAAELAVVIALAHRLQNLVFQAPSGAVAHAQVALERQGGVVVLVLREQVQGLKPLGQRQLRGVEEGAGAQRTLLAAVGALPDPLAVDEKGGVLVLATLGAGEPGGPARLLQYRFALLLGAEAFHEFGQ